MLSNPEVGVRTVSSPGREPFVDVSRSGRISFWTPSGALKGKFLLAEEVVSIRTIAVMLVIFNKYYRKSGGFCAAYEFEELSFFFFLIYLCNTVKILFLINWPQNVNRCNLGQVWLPWAPPACPKNKEKLADLSGYMGKTYISFPLQSIFKYSLPVLVSVTSHTHLG